VTSSADEDRRKETRLSPGDLECDVEGTRFAHVLGVTLGGHGMRVMTDRRLERETPFSVVIHLTDDEDLCFRGEVVWSEEKNFDFTQRYISGVRFVDPDAGSCERLHTFIEQFLAQEQTEETGSSGDPG
jgi:hypothetical protein